MLITTSANALLNCCLSVPLVSRTNAPSELFGPQDPLCLPIDSAQEPSQVCGKCNDCYSE